MILGSLLLASLAVAVVPTGFACDDVAGIGQLCDNGDGTYEADGYDDNGLGPLQGFVYVDTNTPGVCADDNGSHGDSESPTCV